MSNNAPTIRKTENYRKTTRNYEYDAATHEVPRAYIVARSSSSQQPHTHLVVPPFQDYLRLGQQQTIRGMDLYQTSLSCQTFIAQSPVTFRADYRQTFHQQESHTYQYEFGEPNSLTRCSTVITSSRVITSFCHYSSFCRNINL